MDSVQYQLLPYSEGDTYTIPCTIKPGSLRNKYSIEWFQTSRTGFIQLPTSSINLMNFDLHLSSSELLPDRDLYCRVNIQHDSRIWNQRRYCGQKLRRAGTFLHTYRFVCAQADMCIISLFAYKQGKKRQNEYYWLSNRRY